MLPISVALYIVIIYFGNNKGRRVRTKYLPIQFDSMALKKLSNLFQIK